MLGISLTLSGSVLEFVLNFQKNFEVDLRQGMNDLVSNNIEAEAQEDSKDLPPKK